VKRISADEQLLVFLLTTRERDMLIQLLSTYPVVPPAHHAVSKDQSDPRLSEHQRLLDEALAEQRAANRRHVEQWLAKPQIFERAKAGWRLAIPRDDIEWLLQVLNDVRVGNWLRLGRPADYSEAPPADLSKAEAWFAMQLSGYFEASLVAALE
jgi:hypothetical protein